MRPLQALSIRRAGLVLAFFGTLAVSTSCQKKAVCDDVPGSCLALTVVGQGPFDELRTELSLPGGSKRVGTTSGNIDLPLTLRVLPPSGVSSMDVSAVTVAGVLGGATQQSGTTPPTFAWPDGAHIEATVSLEGAAVDGGVEDGSLFDQAGPVDLSQPDLSQPDLSGPPPTLRWTAENVPVGLRRELYGVWSDWHPIVCGGPGRDDPDSWRHRLDDQNSATGANLHGASGFLAGSAWAVGQSPGSLRRGATWANDMRRTRPTAWRAAVVRHRWRHRGRAVGRRRQRQGLEAYWRRGRKRQLDFRASAASRQHRVLGFVCRWHSVRRRSAWLGRRPARHRVAKLSIHRPRWLDERSS
jgi:hypothetical protein